MFTTVRSIFQRANPKPIITSRLQLSTRSPSAAAARITQAFTQLQTSSPNISQAKSPVDPTRAQKIVWLAQRSLASAKGKNQVTQGVQQESQHATVERRQQSDGQVERDSGAQSTAKPWDGLTVWAHLW